MSTQGEGPSDNLFVGSSSKESFQRLEKHVLIDYIFSLTIFCNTHFYINENLQEMLNENFNGICASHISVLNHLLVTLHRSLFCLRSFRP